MSSGASTAPWSRQYHAFPSTQRRPTARPVHKGVNEKGASQDAMNNLRQRTRVSCAETKSLDSVYAFPFFSGCRSILTINPSAQGSKTPLNKAAPNTDRPTTKGRRRNIRGALSNKLTQVKT